MLCPAVVSVSADASCPPTASVPWMLCLSGLGVAPRGALEAMRCLGDAVTVVRIELEFNIKGSRKFLFSLNGSAGQGRNSIREPEHAQYPFDVRLWIS